MSGERPVWDMCGAATQSGAPCRHPAPEAGSRCGSDHVPVNHKQRRITLSSLKQRGWTVAMIRDVLGDPDAEVPNPRYSQAAPMKLYYLRRVEAAETTEQYRQACQKADKRRQAAHKGLTAARAVRDAEDVLKAEAAEVAREFRSGDHAVRLVEAALDLDGSLTMTQRRARRRDANETLERLGCGLCRVCAWRHNKNDPCITTLEHAHEEAQIAARVNDVFADHEHLMASPPPRALPRKPGAVGWSPNDDPDCFSKSEVRRRTGWTADMIVEKLGEPDRVVRGNGTLVKLYLKSRVAAAEALDPTRREFDT